MQPDRRAALGSDQVVHRHAEREVEPARLGDELVKRVLELRTSDPLDFLHLVDRLEHLHPDWRRGQSQVALQSGDDAGPVVTVRLGRRIG